MLPPKKTESAFGKTTDNTGPSDAVNEASAAAVSAAAATGGSRSAEEAPSRRGPAGNGSDADRALGARRPVFMIAPQQAPGLQPLSADFVSQQLHEAPDIEVIGKIEPPRLLGLQSAGGAETSSIVLARMHYDKARQLRSQAGARLLVERDSALTFGLEMGPAHGLANPGGRRASRRWV
jgi:hypothetical protein